jgi:triosephosphate isomerase
MRDSCIAGNWKMNPTTCEEAVSLAKEVVDASATAPGDFAVFVPYPYLGPVGDVLKGSSVGLGAQDCYTEEKGAFTGAVSMGMIKSLGCTYALAGHSERRTVFGENDEDINAKVRVILDSGLKCILCVGEVKEEYEMGLNKEVCAIQLAKCLTGVSEAELSEVVIAYEPVWAIGTGLTATPEIAEDVHKYIRSWFEKTYSKAAADAMRIQYGGSVTPETVDELMSQPDIDGALVGGASLVGEKFSRIMNYKA